MPTVGTTSVGHSNEDPIGPRNRRPASLSLNVPQLCAPFLESSSGVLTDSGHPEPSFQTVKFLRFGELQLSTIVIAVFGIGFLVAESTVLSMQGMQGVGIAVLTILAASTISSIVGFAFSALSGALLFHLMDSPIYAVQVMIVCSIAVQFLSVATLWRSIDWLSLPVFFAGGVLGVPAGVYMLLHLPTNAYRDVIGALLIAYGAYLLLRCLANRHYSFFVTLAAH